MLAAGSLPVQHRRPCLVREAAPGEPADGMAPFAALYSAASSTPCIVCACAQLLRHAASSFKLSLDRLWQVLMYSWALQPQLAEPKGSSLVIA